MSNYVKICPGCGKQNPIFNTNCENPECQISLLRVSPTVLSLEPLEQESKPAEDPKSFDNPISSPDPTPAHSATPRQDLSVQPQHVKLCPQCGRTSKPTSHRCECGRQLFDVLPIPASSVSTPVPLSAPVLLPNPSSDLSTVSYMLRSEDGRLELRLTEGEEMIIGREGFGADYLAPKAYVSRQHIKVLQQNGIVMITHNSRTNPTLVNGVAIEYNKAYKVNDNDLISLGAQEGQSPQQYAAYFKLIKI